MIGGHVPLVVGGVSAQSSTPLEIARERLEQPRVAEPPHDEAIDQHVRYEARRSQELAYEGLGVLETQGGQLDREQTALRLRALVREPR